jgi:NACHT domain
MLGNLLGDGVAKLGRGKRPLQFVLVFVLMFGLVMGAAVPNGAQTPTANVDDEIVRQAKEDAEMGTAQKRKEFRDAFAKDANQKSRSPEDLDKLYTKYVEAYNKAKDAKEVDPKEAAKAPLQDPIGWLMVLGVGTIVGIFKDAVSNAIKKVWTTSTTWIYQRFSGTRWFWNLALEKYRKALVAKHGELKIPFRPNRPLKMDEVYVPLKVAGNRSDKENVEVVQAVRDYRRLMVTGQPGSGKTMLLRYLALNYGAGKLRLVDDPVVILLELWRLSDGAAVLVELVAALAREDFPNGEAFLKQALERGRIVVLLDGLDEVNVEKRRDVVKRIKDFLDTCEKCSVVITCRTQVYQGEFDGVVKQTLEVIEFTDVQIKQFLLPWQVQMPGEKSVQQLVQALNNRPRIKELARNPLLLTIVVYLYCDTPFVLPHSRAEFYAKSTDILLETWDQARQTPNVYKGFTKRLVLQHLALYAQDSAGERQQDRKTLSFREVMKEVQTVLPGLNLDAEKDLQLVVDEIVERSGLLMRIDGGERYQFSHLTLQEYFAAGALGDKPQEMIRRVKLDMDAWREVVKLWCGLANDATEVIREVYKINPMMAFESLADTQNIEANLADEITKYFTEEFRRNTISEELEKAFAVIASDSRPRGQHIFNFLVNALNSKNLTDIKVSSRILSQIYSTKSAQVLSEIEHTNSEIIELLPQLGDLAIPGLLKLINTTSASISISSIKSLIKINSENSIRELIPFLWSDVVSLSSLATWHLAHIIAEQSVENILRNYPLTETQLNSNQFAWIWKPFQEDASSSLPCIAGRIGYLMTILPIPDSITAYDPRLAVPIYAIIISNQSRILYSINRSNNSKKQSINSDRRHSVQSKEHMIEGGKLLLSAFLVQSFFQARKLIFALQPQLQERIANGLSQYRLASIEDWVNTYKTYSRYSIARNLISFVRFPIIPLILTIVSISAIQGTLLNLGNGYPLQKIILFTLDFTLFNSLSTYFRKESFQEISFLGLKTFMMNLNKREILNRGYTLRVWSILYCLVLFTGLLLFSSRANLISFHVVFKIAMGFIISNIIITIFSRFAADLKHKILIFSWFSYIVVTTFFLFSLGKIFGGELLVSIFIWFGYDSWFDPYYRQHRNSLHKSPLLSRVNFINPKIIENLLNPKLLAFPLFCWLPIVLIFTSLFIHNFFNYTWSIVTK